MHNQTTFFNRWHPFFLPKLFLSCFQSSTGPHGYTPVCWLSDNWHLFTQTAAWIFLKPVWKDIWVVRLCLNSFRPLNQFLNIFEDSNRPWGSASFKKMLMRFWEAIPLPGHKLFSHEWVSDLNRIITNVSVPFASFATIHFCNINNKWYTS